MEAIKTPQQCESLEQVRAGIDRLDAQIVRLLAEQQGAMPEVVERIYRGLIEAFTDAEHRHWQQR